MGWLEALQGELAAGRPVALATALDGPAAGGHVVVGAGGAVLADEVGDPSVAAAAAGMLANGSGKSCRPAAGVMTVGLCRIYIEAFFSPPELVVIGAGHVAQPVARLGKLLGFAVTVVEDRPAYANAARFPEADRIVCDDFVTAVRALTTGPQTYVVLVTRGHRYDMDCLRELIDRPLAYIGMIGSRTRVQAVFHLLETEAGIDPGRLNAVYAPIGLDLGARTPAEIAVAVAAELLKVRRGGTGESLSRLGRTQIHRR